jgi:colicin import membrane protein
VSPKYIVAISLSLVLHAMLAAVMLFGDFKSPPEPKTIAVDMNPIQAVAIDKSKLQAQVNKLKKQKSDAKSAEKKRIKALEDRASTAKKKRANEEARIKKLERQRKKKEQEKNKADADAKASKAKAAVADKIRKTKEQEKQKAEQAAAKAKARRLKEEAEAKASEKQRKKKLAERKKKEQNERERAEQERMLELQLAEEMASRSQARKQQHMTEINRFTALITQVIQGNLITDRSTMEGKSCKLTISLAPSGFVTNVVSGQGERSVCEAAKKAVYKAGNLPVSKNPEIFKEMNNISLTVVPEF